MLDLNYEIGLAELALVEVAGGTLLTDSELTSNNFDGSTLLLDAVAQSSLSFAGQAQTQFVGVIAVTTAVGAVGASVFDARIAGITTTALSADGSATVSLEAADLDSQFSIQGSSVVSFFSQAVSTASASMAGQGTLAGDAAGVQNSQFVSEAVATETLLGSALTHTTLVSSGAATAQLVGTAIAVPVLTTSGAAASSFAGSAYGALVFSSAGLSAAGMQSQVVRATAYSASGVGTGVFSVGTTSSAVLAAAGVTTLYLGGTARYDELPLAWDYIIRPYELRAALREFEQRAVLRESELRAVERPEEDRTATYS